MVSDPHKESFIIEAIYWPLPKLNSDLPGPKPIALDKIAAENHPAESVGTVKNKSGFSEQLSLPPGLQNFFIKAPGSGFYLPPKYEQFAPSLEQIIKHYYSKHGDDGYCLLGIRQEVIEPKQKGDQPFIDGHKDFNKNRDEITGAPVYLDHRTYIVSDCLTTGVSNLRFPRNVLQEITASDKPGTTIGKFLSDPAVKYTPCEPYEIICFDSTTAHALANPKAPTMRTVMVVIFGGPEFKPAENAFANNPWLASCIKKLKQPDLQQQAQYVEASRPRQEGIAPLAHYRQGS